MGTAEPPAESALVVTKSLLTHFHLAMFYSQTNIIWEDLRNCIKTFAVYAMKSRRIRIKGFLLGIRFSGNFTSERNR